MEEEDDNVQSPDLLLAAQIDTEGDLERELHTLNLDVSVHSEYQQAKQKSPRQNMVASKVQSPKSLQTNGKLVVQVQKGSG